MSSSQDYAWADAGAKVKVYIEVPLGPEATDDSARGPNRKVGFLDGFNLLK